MFFLPNAAADYLVKSRIIIILGLFRFHLFILFTQWLTSAVSFTLLSLPFSLTLSLSHSLANYRSRKVEGHFVASSSDLELINDVNSKDAAVFLPLSSSCTPPRRYRRWCRCRQVYGSELQDDNIQTNFSPLRLPPFRRPCIAVHINIQTPFGVDVIRRTTNPSALLHTHAHAHASVQGV